MCAGCKPCVTMPMSATPARAERFVIAVTPGDPAGVGPDLVVLQEMDASLDLVLIADPDVLHARAGLRGLARAFPLYEPGVSGLSVLPVPLGYACIPGHPDPRCADYVLSCLRRATTGCLSGEFDALVTGPIHKASINEAGFPFTGHTEFLADHSGVEQVVMMLVAGSLRVALVTTHLPLSEVPGAITGERLDVTLRILREALVRDFGIPRPRIVVLGLNPHAGEGGHLGMEERLIIEPACARARAAGFDIVGPIPADTAFVPAHLKGVDAVLAMYHDQGLPVLKAQGFGEAVNVTLGLPFIRTSVDHGTAFDRAGSGVLDTGSFMAAVALAKTLCKSRVVA